MNLSLFSKKYSYLDWASAAPVHPRALRVFLKAQKAFGNPSSPHIKGRESKDVLETARMQIARLAGVKSRAVIFTSGATEANALAIEGRVRKCAQQGMSYSDMHVLYLPTMHSSVLKTLQELTKRGVVIEPLPLKGMSIDLEVAAKHIRPSTVLVSVDAVCGETGTRFESLRLKRLIPSNSKALLHVDASQLPLVEQIEHTRLGADLLVLDAQKVGGVRGVGALISPHAQTITPIVHGGGQEQGLRPGTEPVALIAAFAEALTVCAEGYGTFAESAREHREMLRSLIVGAIPEAVINESKHQAPHILHISLPGFDTDYAVALLDRDGFALSTKSACETDSEDGSKAIYAFTGNTSLASSTLRISWGPGTTTKELRRFAEALKVITTFLRKN
jgi:cysteine desulfurase